MNLIYLDNNSTTPLLPAVWEEMRPYFLDHAGNPASSHQAGRRARQALEDAREGIAHLLGAKPDQVLFTSGATEANNLAILGQSGDAPGHFVSSPLEHPSVAEPIQRLVSRGFTSSHLPVSPVGVVDVDSDFIRPNTRLVAVMLANHETGAVQPVEQLARKVAGHCPLHCDAAAAAGKMRISFRQLDVDSLTVSAHKFHGPKGVGVLLVKSKERLCPLFWGGHQQHGKRPGTEPVPLAVGMAAALALAMRDLDANRAHVLRLRRIFLERLRESSAPAVLSGPEEGGIPHTVNLAFPGCSADVLLMKLDLAGIACSTGSACSSGSLLPSPVLRSMGIHDEILLSALRFSFSTLLKEEMVLEASERITRSVKELRQQFAGRRT